MEKDNFFCKRKEGIEDYIAEHICLNAPVITGLKPSAIITVTKAEKQILEELFSGTEICVISLHSGKKESILLYQREKLEELLSRKTVQSFLQSLAVGYESFSLEEVFRHFTVRFAQYKEKQADFPHEVGVFLGYPLRDVKIYMKNPLAKAKLTGYWKVFNEVESALSCFQAYDMCIQSFTLMLKSGLSCRDLVMAYHIKKRQVA